MMLTPNQTTDINAIDLLIQPSETFQVNWDTNRLRQFIDEYEAVYQAVQKLLRTERNAYPIYTSNYGIELDRLIGKDISFVKADITRILNEALLADDRILSVENVTITNTGKDSLELVFDVVTVFGKFPVETAVATT